MKRLLLIVSIVSSLSACTAIGRFKNPPKKPDNIMDAVAGAPENTNDDDSFINDMLTVNRKDPVPNDPAWAPIQPNEKPEHYVAATGSLFDAEHTRNLYDDAKPHGIGDIVTVLLQENTKAAKSADTGLSKSNDASMDPVNLGGKEIKIRDYNLSYKLGNETNFSGNASANQSNSISGSITVEVVDVLSNGNLVIRGEKWLTLNTGDEYIRLSGTIRPDDIDAKNTIKSTRISNARIKYSGTGTEENAQQPGYLSSFFQL